jgi:hypothetical protein
VIDPQRRDFKERIVKELALTEPDPVLESITGQESLEIGA